MGNASSKDRHDDSVDFGALHPQGIYTGPQDWNTEIVGRLIVERKLAPYYRPLEDYDDSWDDEQILAARKEPPPPPLPEPGQASSSGQQQAPPPTPVTPHHYRPSSGKSAKAAAKEPQRLSEVKVYHNAVECPICFMVSDHSSVFVGEPLHDGFAPSLLFSFTRSTTHQTSIIRGAVTSRSVPSVSFRSNEPNLPRPIWNRSLPVARTAYSPTMECCTNHLRGGLALAVMGYLYVAPEELSHCPAD